MYSIPHCIPGFRRLAAPAVAVLFALAAAAPAFAQCCCSGAEPADVAAQAPVTDAEHAHCHPAPAESKTQTRLSADESPCVCTGGHSAPDAVPADESCQPVQVIAVPAPQPDTLPLGLRPDARPVNSDIAEALTGPLHLVHCAFLI